MFIYIEDLIFYMEGLSNEQLFFDCSIGEVLTNSLLNNKDSSQCVPIPVFNDTDIIVMYLQQLNDKKLQYLLKKVKQRDFLSIFHVAINDAGLYGDYVIFSKNQKIQIAQNWCDINNIKCTTKRKQG